MSDSTTQARQLARVIASWDADLSELAQTTSRETVAAAISGFDQAMLPMNQRQKAERIEDQRELARMIGMIGVRVRPDFERKQAENWTAAMVDALDDLPARIAIAACRDAKYEPIEFPGQVLGIIRKKAESHMASYRLKIRRLKALLKLIDHPPLIEASDEAKAEAKALSDAELQDMPSALRSMGLSAGFLIESEGGLIRWATDEEQEAHQREQKERRIARARKGSK